MESIQAALTGDLIASSDAGSAAVDGAMEVLRTAAADIAAWRFAESTAVGDTRFTRFRGDGWQILVSKGTFGPRAALSMYARLAARPDLPRTRVAIGLGTVDTLPGPDLSDALGAALAISGRTLAEMRHGEQLRIAGTAPHGPLTPLTAAFVALIDDRIADWTPEQAEAVARVIAPGAPTQNAIAASLGISPQALSARLTGAKWPTLRTLLARWEEPQPRAAPDA